MHQISVIFSNIVYFSHGWRGLFDDNNDNLRPNQYPLGAQGAKINNNLNNIIQQLLRAKQHIARSRNRAYPKIIQNCRKLF